MITRISLQDTMEAECYMTKRIRESRLKLKEWIESKDGTIIEAEYENEHYYAGREILYKSERPRLMYGEVKIIDKENVVWN